MSSSVDGWMETRDLGAEKKMASWLRFFKESLPQIHGKYFKNCCPCLPAPFKLFGIQTKCLVKT